MTISPQIQELFIGLKSLNPRPALFPSHPVSAEHTQEINALTAPPLMKAILHLWNDDLEGAHQIVQSDKSVDSHYLHALLHRRERDFSNSLYWFARVGNHPAWKRMQESFTNWSAKDFVRRCESETGTSELETMQAREMEILFALIAGEAKMTG